MTLKYLQELVAQAIKEHGEDADASKAMAVTFVRQPHGDLYEQGTHLKANHEAINGYRLEWRTVNGIRSLVQTNSVPGLFRPLTESQTL